MSSNRIKYLTEIQEKRVLDTNPLAFACIDSIYQDVDMLQRVVHRAAGSMNLGNVLEVDEDDFSTEYAVEKTIRHAQRRALEYMGGQMGENSFKDLFRMEDVTEYRPAENKIVKTGRTAAKNIIMQGASAVGRRECRSLEPSDRLIGFESSSLASPKAYKICKNAVDGALIEVDRCIVKKSKTKISK